MLKVYTDASWDPHTRIGAYCITYITDEGKKDYVVYDHDNCTTNNDLELVALRHAVDLVETVGVPAEIFCDNQSAISKAHKDFKYGRKVNTTGLVIRFIKGHQMKMEGVVIDEDIKLHHWTDRMAGMQMSKRLDKYKTGA